MATWTVGGRGQVPGVLGACLMHFCGGFPSFRPVSDRILCLALVLVAQRALRPRGAKCTGLCVGLNRHDQDGGRNDQFWSRVGT